MRAPFWLKAAPLSNQLTPWGRYGSRRYFGRSRPGSHPFVSMASRSDQVPRAANAAADLWERREEAGPTSGCPETCTMLEKHTNVTVCDNDTRYTCQEPPLPPLLCVPLQSLSSSPAFDTTTASFVSLVPVQFTSHTSVGNAWIPLHSKSGMGWQRASLSSCVA